MRVAHLADLHLGKCILEQSLIEDQVYILKEIVRILKCRSVDMVLIAGDIYDKYVPSIEAVNLFSSFLTQLYHLGIKVLVISGNHDSKDRLSFGKELFSDNDVYIEGVFQGTLKKACFYDDYGFFNVYMLPFIKPADVRKVYVDEEISSYQEAVSCILKHTDIDTRQRNIIMVHQFVTAYGVEIERSESEILSLGGIDNVDVHLFDEFDYVALGHVHGAQRILRDTIRYAGSPLKYSFSEVFQKKSLPIIEFKEKGNVEVELVDLIPRIDMRKVQGSFLALMNKEIYQQGNCADYLEVILTDEDCIVDAISKLRTIYPNILKLEYLSQQTNFDEMKTLEVVDIKRETPLSLFEKFYCYQNGREMDERRREIVKKVMEEVMDETN